jgi:hypothetical protein
MSTCVHGTTTALLDDGDLLEIVELDQWSLDHESAKSCDPCYICWCYAPPSVDAEG